MPKREKMGVTFMYITFYQIRVAVSWERAKDTESDSEREKERERRGLTSHSKHWTRPPRSIEERSCMNIIVRLSFSREGKQERETERER